jgi:hypothetical protein
MKSATSALFVASVAAAADYGYGISSSTPIGYTTITPGYGKEPVTVTSQYQPIPTYVSSKSSWAEYPYVSTVITDCDGKKVTITKVEDPVTVYHTKSTITKYVTEHPAPTGGYPYAPKNATTTKAYYELYEKIHECKYKDLGPKVLPGYPGSGLSKHDKDHQPVVVKEYKNGKWEQHTQTLVYGEPKPSVTTYDAPGTYTVPAYDLTVETPYTAPAEATKTCDAGKPVTYGGAEISVSYPTTTAVAYGEYETHGDKTKTVIKYKTITAPSAGVYEVAKPTVTSYAHDTTIIYATVTYYAPGVYHHPVETVTITKSGEPYTCSYSQTETYPTPSAYPTETPEPTEAYPTETPSGTTPYPADPSADYPEPAENYGTPYAGYVKRGGMLERRSADKAAPKKAQAGKRVILV